MHDNIIQRRSKGTDEWKRDSLILGSEEEVERRLESLRDSVGNQHLDFRVTGIWDPDLHRKATDEYTRWIAEEVNETNPGSV